MNYTKKENPENDFSKEEDLLAPGLKPIDTMSSEDDSPEGNNRTRAVQSWASEELVSVKRKLDDTYDSMPRKPGARKAKRVHLTPDSRVSNNIN